MSDNRQIGRYADAYTDLVISKGENAVRAELQRLQSKIANATRMLEQGYVYEALKALKI